MKPQPLRALYTRAAVAHRAAACHAFPHLLYRGSEPAPQTDENYSRKLANRAISVNRCSPKSPAGRYMAR